MPLHHRQLHARDLDLICRHRHEMFLETGRDAATLADMTGHFRPWLAPRLADGRYFGFLLLDGETPVAGIGLMALDWPPHPSHPRHDQRGYVLNVYVEHSHRRRGLGRQLMQLAEAEFARRELPFAILHPTEMGKPMYAELGWKVTTEMAKAL